MVDEVLFGVFFEDFGSEYLVAIFDDEEAATEDARMRDEAAFEEAVSDAGETGAEVEQEHFEGMHYVESISRELADASYYELERGLTVRVVDN
jgi:hypothetical protein